MAKAHLSAVPESAKLRILVIEEEPALAGVLRCSLDQEGFAAIEVHDCDKALTQIREQRPDAIILGSPRQNERTCDLRGRIRGALSGRKIPLILLLPSGAGGDCLCDADGGADDCIVKPFGMQDLVARLRAAFCHVSPPAAAEVLTYADITLDPKAFRVWRGKHFVHLGPRDFRLLLFFLQHPCQVFTRQSLLDAIWGPGAAVSKRTIDVHMKRLREALNVNNAPEIIRTVRSVGYALDREAPIVP